MQHLPRQKFEIGEKLLASILQDKLNDIMLHANLL